MSDAPRSAAAGSPHAREITDVASVGFVKRLVAAMGEHHLAAFASALAYGAVFAVLPILALLVLLLGLFDAAELIDRSLVELRGVLPAEALTLIDGQLAVLTRSDEGGLGFGVLISALVALYGASGAMRRVMEALNVVHAAEETRGFVRRLLVSVALALGAIATIVVAMTITVVGGSFASHLFDVVGLGETAADVWAVAKWPALLAVIWLAVALLYRFAPASRQVGGIATPGTLIATAGWVAFSLAFSLYVGSIGNMGDTWGTAAGVIVFLLYVQYTGLIILLGAQVDVLLFDQERPAARWRRLLHVPAAK